MTDSFIKDVISMDSVNLLAPTPLFEMSVPEQIRFHKYLIDEHQIETEDGYILTAFRIKGKQGENLDNVRK